MAEDTRQLGNYRIIRRLGRGGFAEVYLGEHIYLKNLVAIKILRTQVAAQDAGEFLTEAQMLVQLKHPHIVRIFEFGVEDETPYLVMEYAEQGTLGERYPKGTHLDLSLVVTYMRQIGSALEYAHAQKLIHRDLKIGRASCRERV